MGSTNLFVSATVVNILSVGVFCRKSAVGLAHGRRFAVENKRTQERTDAPVTSLADLINLLDAGDVAAANLTSLHAIMACVAMPASDSQSNVGNCL